MSKKKFNSRFLPSAYVPRNATNSTNARQQNPDINTVGRLAVPEGLAGGMQVQFFHLATERRAEFAAFITTFSDSFTSNWDMKEAMGRMDPIMNFKNTQRSMTLGFEVPAIDREDAKRNAAEVNRLIQFLYPTYTSNGSARTMNGSPLVKVQFQNIIASGKNRDVGTIVPEISIDARENGLIAAITSLTATPNYDVGTFGAEEFLIKGGGAISPVDLVNDGPTMQYPKLWTVDLTLTILHDHSMDSNFANAGAFPYHVSTPEALTPARFVDNNAGSEKPKEKNKPSTNPNVTEPQEESAPKPGEPAAKASTGKEETQKDVKKAQEEEALQDYVGTGGNITSAQLLKNMGKKPAKPVQDIKF